MRKLRLSPRFDSREALASYIEQQGFDVVISGSDQVFNPRIDDFDEAFLLPFDTPCRKASFAASLGGSEVTRASRICRYAARFRYVVR